MKVSFDELGPNARIWIYQSSSPLSDQQVVQIDQVVDEFVSQWAAHQQPLAAFGKVFHHRFVVLMVDERLNMASGCSIDASVAFIKSLEQQFNISLFDRMTFSYEKDGQIFTVPREQFSSLYKSGQIGEDTLVFDNLIKTKSEWADWQKPLGQSWLKRFV